MAIPERDLLTVLQKSARNRTLLTSCEPEVQELMHQIDVLISSKQKEWENKLQVLRTQLQHRERDLSLLRVTVQEREAQIEQLKQQNAALQHECKVKNGNCEAEVLRLRTELSRLHHNYEQLKAKRSHAGKQLDMVHTMQNLQAKSLEANQLREEKKSLQARLNQQQQESTDLLSQLKLTRLEASALQEKCNALEGELKLCRSQLDHQQSLETATEQRHTARIRQLEMQLRCAQDVAVSKKSFLKCTKLDRDESRQQPQSAWEECKLLCQQLSETQQNLQQLEKQNAELKTQLKRKEELMKGMEVEATTKSHSLQLLQETLRKKDEAISSLEVPQGLPHFPRCSSTQAQSLQSSIEKKLQEGTTRQRQENKATQQEDAKLQADRSVEPEDSDSSVHGRIDAIEKFVLDVNQLLASSKSQSTAAHTSVKDAEFVALKPVAENTSNVAKISPSLCVSSGSTSPSYVDTFVVAPGANVDHGRTLEGILDKHFEEMDQSLQRILKMDKT